MIKKLIKIKNYGKFHNYNSSQSDWDGSFKKVTTIYASNGSGKTSLALLFRSLKNDDSLILKKREFGNHSFPEIILLGEDNKEIKYTNKRWNKHLNYIHVFDSFYLEDNVYVITIEDEPNNLNFFEISADKSILAMKNEIKELMNKLSIIRKKVRMHKQNIKKNNNRYGSIDKLPQLIARRDKLADDIKALQEEIMKITVEQREQYRQKINNYLSLFTDDLLLTKFRIVNLTGKQKIVYSLSISGNEVRLDESENISLKYYLSDGDKNALALSFFFAQMSLLPDINERCIIIDDPFSSFDLQRKRTTITQIIRLAEQAKQVIILTHDMHFAHDFKLSYHGDILNLIIKRSNNGSVIARHDISSEMLTGLMKDMKTLHNYLKYGEQNDLYLREVVRCIRPCVEGVFRIKYYEHINENQWLGDFIQLIRNADENSTFNKLKGVLSELEEINTYSKIYHHSNPSYLENRLEPKELEIFVKRTINLIKEL